MYLFRQLQWFFLKHWRTYSIALLLLGTVAIMNVSIPYVIGNIIDLLVTEQELSSSVQRHMLLLFGLGLGVYALRFTWRQILFGTAYKLGTLLRTQFYQRLTRLGAEFYSNQGTGDLMAKATNDIDAIEVAAGEGVLSGFDGALTFILVLIMMLSIIDWRLTLIALIPFPFMGFTFYKISIAIHQHFGDALASFSELNDRTQETLSGIRSVKAMGREELERDAFNTIADKAAKASFKVARKEALFEPAIYLSMASAMLLTLGFGGYFVAQQEISIGQLASCTLYLVQLIWPMWAFGWLLNILERGSAAHKRVSQLINTPDTIQDNGQTIITTGHLQVSGLNYQYPSASTTDVNALQDIDFNLPPGKTLGIVGPTGSGKSTLLSLIMRQREACANQAITIDSRPIIDCTLASIQRLFAYVPQDSFLFSLTIAQNIALSRPNASATEIEHAAKLASLHDDIMSFDQGYETRVGERGITLSGGQRQRLTLARALLTKANILVLDDALSAVDVATEQKIIQHLRQRAKNQGCIIVCHRLSAVEHLDETLVIQDGTITEHGNHQQLMEQDGWYSRMWAYQQMEAAVNE